MTNSSERQEDLRGHVDEAKLDALEKLSARPIALWRTTPNKLPRLTHPTCGSPIRRSSKRARGDHGHCFRGGRTGAPCRRAGAAALTVILASTLILIRGTISDRAQPLG